MKKGTHTWLNGELVGWEKATVHIVSETFSYGYGVFEGVRCYSTKDGPCIFRLRDHMERLVNSAKILFLKIPYSLHELEDAALDTVEANGFSSCYIRPMVYVSSYFLSSWDFSKADVDVAIAVWDWGEYISKKATEEGLKVKTSSYTRHHVNVTMTKAKANSNYTNLALAKGEALRQGFDEALLLDTNGYVAEGPVENVFIVSRGEIITPPAANILEGITRDTIMRIARDTGLVVREEFFSRDKLYVADEVFMTGTAAEVVPVTEVDRIVIGSGSPGPVTTELMERYARIVRHEEPDHREWLWPVQPGTRRSHDGSLAVLRGSANLL